MEKKISLERNNFHFEVCANGVESCIAAQNGGADRVELCAGIPEGGTTPSYGEILQAREKLNSTLLHVIIRPRGGDFLYNNDEIERMASDIRMARECGVDGVVFGCLTPEGMVDMQKNAYLMEQTAGMSVTFHRAFDHTCDPKQALEDIIKLGFNRILTSGQQPTAPQGIALLSELQQQSARRITILAGCGVNESNIKQLFLKTNISEFHFSARQTVVSKMRFSNPTVYMGKPDADELTLQYTTAERVKNTIAALLS